MRLVANVYFFGLSAYSGIMLLEDRLKGFDELLPFGENALGKIDQLHTPHFEVISILGTVFPKVLEEAIALTQNLIV